MRALSIAATGMSAQQMRVEVISNNLANMSTTGYNARRAEFADLHYQQFTRPGTINAADGTLLPTGVQLGLGVRPAAVSVQIAQGTLAASGGDLDIAIEGHGYLEVTMPSGISAYTRDGGLKRSADGQVVTSDGHPVVPGITIPEETRSLSINAEGEVYAYFSDQVEPELLGQFSLATFPNEKGLEALGSNLFGETAASGPASVGIPGTDGLGTLRQGYLEESSVDAVREITELIQAQRGYELNAKVISAADQMLGATTQIPLMRWLVLLLLATPAAAETVVAARTVRSQALLGPADLIVVAGEVPGAAITLDEVLGQEARVMLYAGRPVLLDQVGPPALVDRNELVELTFRHGALTITAEGRALGRAGAGDSVRVMNLASKKTVTGLVMDDGSIVVRRP